MPDVGRRPVAAPAAAPHLSQMHSLIILTAFLAAGGATAADTAAAFMGHGVSHALARDRARTISEVRYALTLDVTARDSAVGWVAVQFRRSGKGDVILDFRGRRLLKASANGHELPDGAANGAHIRVSAALLAAGDNALDFEFVADIAPSGASIIRFHDQTDGSYYLYTLLVPADANQLFPCFDQPDKKATFDIMLDIDKGLQALHDIFVHGRQRYRKARLGLK
jgi:aminopeptidase N